MPPKATATFKLRSGESWRDPFSMYKALRDFDPVHHASDGDYYVLTRFDDVFAAAADSETFSSASGLTVNYGEIESAGMGDATPMVFLDPPEHTQFRNLVTKRLTPRKVADIEPAIREFVVSRIERCRELGQADIVSELFKPLPSFVVAHYLGVPEDERALFDVWTEAIVQAAATGDVATSGDAFGDLLGYFAGLIERRRTEPADDIVSELVALGEDTVSIARILGFTFTMVTGGNDTVTGLLSGGSCLLTDRPEQRTKLLRDPDLIAGAVEELLRLTSPVQNLARTATRDVTINGVKIPKGRKVLLSYAAANRDDREFGPAAEECEVERKIKKILSLSYGTHYCIGAAAARLQGRVVFEELLARCPDFSVDVDGGRYAPGNYVRRHESLPWATS
ncbi:MAG: cytochrome P450 [Hyphomicrobiaceae bacterium]|jgi:cytochrome P450